MTNIGQEIWNALLGRVYGEAEEHIGEKMVFGRYLSWALCKNERPFWGSMSSVPGILSLRRYETSLGANVVLDGRISWPWSQY
jgi:hypothetical protein